MKGVQRKYYETLRAQGRRPSLVCGCGCGARLNVSNHIWSRDLDLAFVNHQHYQSLKAELEQAEAEREYLYA